MISKTKISWEAPEFKHYEKNLGWYVTAFSILIILAGFFAFVQNDWFGAISTIILGILIVYFSKQKPDHVEIELDHKRVKLGSIEIPYKQIKHFWIVHNERHQAVNLETTTLVNSQIILELGSQNPEEVRIFLLQYLPEHEKTEETLAQKFMHWLKF
jgi:hypothetical protein